MKSSVEKLNDIRVKLTVEVPFEELKPQIDAAFKTLATQVNIPGFRRGKAPRQVLEARIGRGPVLEQVANDAINEYYGRALDEHEINPLGAPAIDVTKLEDNVVIEFTAEVDVRPEFEVPNFEEISVEVPAVEATDADVDAEIESLRQRFATTEPVERAVAEGDEPLVNITFTADGEPVEGGVEGFSLRVGSNILPGLDEAIVGLSAGESKTFDANEGPFAEEGVDVQAIVEVLSNNERVLPEIDDEFAQEATGADTVDEMRDELREQIKERRGDTQAMEIRDAVLAAALDKVNFPLPEGLVQENIEAQVDQLIAQFGGQPEMLDVLIEARGQTREEFDAKQREDAEKAVRTQLLLDAVADVEKPEVSQEELTQQLMFLAQNFGMEPQQLVQVLQSNGQLGNVFADVRRGKALALVILKTTVKDSNGETVDTEKYFGSDEDSAE